MNIVNWCIMERDLKSNIDSVFNLVYNEPISLLEYITNSRSGSRYLKCPAFIDYSKNTFVITSPFNYNFNVTQDGNVDDNGSAPIANQLLNVRKFDRDPSDPHMITIPPFLVFYSEDDIEVEVIPAGFHNMNHNCNIIPGKYNISKWIRPVEYTAEINDISKPVQIKKNDPMFYVRFIPKNNKKVTLNRVDFSEKINRAVFACTGVKAITPNQSLPSLYKRSVPWLKTLNLFNKNKCPFRK